MAYLNFNVIGLELLFFLIGCLLFFVKDFIKKEQAAFFLSLVTLLFALIFVFFLPFGDFTQSFRLDFFSSSMKFLMIFGGILILLLSRGYFNKYLVLNYPEYFGLLFFSLLGSFVMVSAMDLLTFYIAIELMSFPVYFLIAMGYKINKKGIEGAFKYFFLGVFSSVFFILGIAILYAYTGSFFFKDLIFVLGKKGTHWEILLGALFVIAGISIKLSFVPFHMWAPDAYEGASLPITAFMSGIIKFSVLATLVKVMLMAFFPLRIEIGKIFLPIVLLTILGGNLMAIKQQNLVRMLAYSSIAHAGYASLGFIIADFTGYTFTVFYAFTYMIMSIGAFGLVAWLESCDKRLVEIPNLGILGKKNGLVSFLILLFMFSLAGIPPTAGFVAKFYLLLGLVKAGSWLIAVLVLLFSVIGAYPYIRVVKCVYMDKALEKVELRPFKWEFWLPIGLCSVLILLMGIYPQPFASFFYKTMFLYLSFFYFGS